MASAGGPVAMTICLFILFSTGTDCTTVMAGLAPGVCHSRIGAGNVTLSMPSGGVHAAYAKFLPLGTPHARHPPLSRTTARRWTRLPMLHRTSVLPAHGRCVPPSN